MASCASGKRKKQLGNGAQEFAIRRRPRRALLRMAACVGAGAYLEGAAIARGAGMTTTDTCPIHTSDDALNWCITEGVKVNTYGGKVVRVTHRATGETAVRCIGKNGNSMAGDFMMCCRDVWAKVEAFKRVK
jgi:hypothetical protein